MFKGYFQKIHSNDISIKLFVAHNKKNMVKAKNFQNYPLEILWNCNFPLNPFVGYGD